MCVNDIQVCEQVIRIQVIGIWRVICVQGIYVFESVRWKVSCVQGIYVFDSVSWKQMLHQALVLSHFDYCLVIWSSAAKKDLAKLQLAQNRAARLVLNCTHRTNINNMQASLSWLRVDER